MAAVDYVAVVQQLYISYFGRPADTFGLKNFTEQLDALHAPTDFAELNAAAQAAPTGPLGALVNSFNSSDEAKALYGSDNSELGISKFLVAVFQNVLGRDPEAGPGFDFWFDALASGQLTRANAAMAITEGALSNTTPQGLLDAAVVQKKLEVATNFTEALDTPVKQNAYSTVAAIGVASGLLKGVTPTTDVDAYQANVNAAVDAVVTGSIPTQTFTLTTGVDTGTAFTGGSGTDTFNGNASTFSALDQLDGGAGNDNLNLFSVNKDGVATSLDLSLVTSVKNIENLVVTSTTSALANDKANVSSWTGLTNATFNVKGAAVQAVTVADTTAVTVNNSAGGVTISGGSKAIVASGAAAVAGTGSANALAVTSAAAAAAKTAADALDTATKAGQTAGIAADAGGAGAADDMAAIKAAFAGTAGVSAADIATVNAAADDAATLAAMAAVVAANTAAATAAATKATAAAAAVAAEGAGAVIIAGAALTSASVVGGTTVSVSDNDSGTLTSVSLKGNSSTATLTGDALTTVSLTDIASNVSIVNTTAKHTLNLGVNAVGAAAAAVTVTDAAATTVNLTVSGAKASTVSNVNLATAAATALNVDTAAALTLTTTGLAAADALKSLTVKGAGSVTADVSGISTLAAIDLSASTGKNTLTVDGAIAAATIAGGAGADSITVTGALDAKSSINLGAGNDTYKFSTAAVAGALVNGGEGSDTLAVANGALLNADAAKVYSGFEVLEIGGGTGSYDMSVLSLNAVTLTGTALTGATTISNATAATTVAITAKASTDFTTAQVLTYALKDATGKADALNLTLNAVDGNNNGTANGKVTVTGIVAAGIETVNVVSNATADVADADAGTKAVAANKYVNTITSLTADAATSVVLTGAASTTITTIQSSTLTKIDASAATGDVTITNAVLNTAAGAAVNAVTYIGGSGVDTYTATAKGDVFSGNAGADVVTLAAGKDTIALVKASDSILTLTDTTTPTPDGIADTATGFDSVTGFSSTNDKIDISSLNIATGSARGSITLKTAAADTAAALQTIIGTGADFFNDGVADRGVSLVTAGANSYLFVDANGDGNYTAGTDAVIKLVGVTALVLTDVAFG